MDGSWHVVLRDILVILAAAAVITMSAVTVLVGWQLWRLGKELKAELQPILDSVQHTADTVQDTASFMGQRAIPPTANAVGLTTGAVRLYRSLETFYQGMRRDDEPVEVQLGE